MINTDVEDTISKVFNVLELILQISEKNNIGKKSAHDVYSIVSNFTHVTNCNVIEKQNVELLVKSISNHRYNEALKLLWLLSQDITTFIPFLFKAVMIVLLNLEFNGKNETIWKIICSLQSFRAINKQDIQLEYFMLSLKNNVHSIKSVEELIFFKKQSGIRKEEINSIFLAYTELFHYIVWLNTYYGELLSSSLSSHSQASDETKKFENFIKISGDWDIFIPKLITLMKSCGKEDEIEEILLKYLNGNSNNINAYIYLCVYLYYTNQESPNLLKYLEILSHMCPSDVRVLWLIKIWNSIEEKNSKCLRYIFMFLDYPINGKNLIAWQLLLQNILKFSSEDEQDVIKNLWTIRCKSWGWIHFNLHQLQHLSIIDKEILPYKVAFLLLINKNHLFIEEIKINFPSLLEGANLIKRKEIENC